MFTKKVKVGGGQYGVYKDVIDWETVGLVTFWGLVALFLLKACGG